ncbi:penicillin-binding transpeptidase domain-containing protein [Actinoplanes sp. NPDC020271]|uniref:peptidoglycan D,D-transpeptidase FtsI family protein n=1 Tax=Actinoplanes sp. NPDC020271 TaxID=3363896 RepID=UPI0037A4AC4D
MSPRADDETPRRGTPPRRGTSRAVPAEGNDEPERPERRGFSGIGEARAYTPRGRTVAERGRTPRTGRTADPFRPALQVVEGGEGQRVRQRAARTAEPREAEPRETPGRERERTEKREPQKREPQKRARAAAEKTDSRVRRDTVPPRAASSRRTPKPEDRPRRTVTEKSRRGPARRPRPVPAEPPKLANSTRRLRLGTVLALSLFVMIGVRLVVLQVGTSPSEVASLVKLREKRLSTVELPAPRGSIMDRDGAVLANSVEARYVYADPENAKLQKKIPETAAKLAPLLGVAPSELAGYMQRKQMIGGTWLKFRYLKRGVDISVASQIEKLKLDGIYTHSDERRDVPGKDLAANLIGFTGDNQHGLEGLEARYDDLLHGTDGKRVFETGAGSLNVPIAGGYEQETPAKPGNSLKLTIDQLVQWKAQHVLDDEAKKNNAKVAGAVVLDARTGEVIAQASYPAYNAAKGQDYDFSQRIDVPTAVVTDPGSSHKPFMIGAALQEGLITPDSTVTVAPAIDKGGTPFRDHEQVKKGDKLTIAGILAYSSNVGTIRIGDMLGKDRIYEYQQKFGLGKATGEGMPGEASGLLLKPEDWSGSAYGSVPIGLSVSATMVQMAGGYGAIANDGVYIQPHLIKSTVSGTDGTETPAAAPETHRVLDAKVASELRTLMEAVVEDEGTGVKAQVPGYRVAGKTGTGALVVDGRYTDHNASSFVGMAPAESPRYVVAVAMDVPKGTGGEVAAPAFSQIMSYTLTHYLVPPSTTKAPTLKIRG